MVGLISVVALAVACATASPPTISEPVAPVAAPPDAIAGGALDGTIPWTAGRRLTWSDFVGPPIGSRDAAAVTTYTLWWQADCTPDGFGFQVVAAFLPQYSWVRPSVLQRMQESQRALGHEQTHFDLSEVHARKMRQALSRLSRPCDLTEAEVKAVVDPFVLEDQTRQALYDEQTVHGLDVLQQAAWDDEVARQLQELSRYVGPPLGPSAVR